MRHNASNPYIIAVSVIEARGRTNATEFLKRYAFLTGLETFQFFIEQTQRDRAAKIPPEKSFAAGNSVQYVRSQMFPDNAVASPEKFNLLTTPFTRRRGFKGAAALTAGATAWMLSRISGSEDGKINEPAVAGTIVSGGAALVLATSAMVEQEATLLQVIDYINPIIKQSLPEKTAGKSAVRS